MLGRYKIARKGLALKVSVFVVVVFAMTYYFQSNYRFVVTPSVPEGIYKTHHFDPAKVAYGDIVVFDYRSCCDTGKEGLVNIFTKRVVGLPGDQIVREGLVVRIKRKNGEEVQLNLFEKGSDGDPLPRVGSQTIPRRMMFVAGEHPQSFDSRYFGLVGYDHVQNKATIFIGF